MVTARAASTERRIRGRPCQGMRPAYCEIYSRAAEGSRSAQPGYRRGGLGVILRRMSLREAVASRESGSGDEVAARYIRSALLVLVVYLIATTIPLAPFALE